MYAKCDLLNGLFGGHVSTRTEAVSGKFGVDVEARLLAEL